MEQQVFLANQCPQTLQIHDWNTPFKDKLGQPEMCEQLQCTERFVPITI